MFNMKNEIVPISPEGLEVANQYLHYGNVQDVSETLKVPKDQVVELLGKREVKRYLDTIYLDMGYRNRDKLGELMDTIIESKLEDAAESGMYSSKDLIDIIHMAHKMRMDEIKAMNESTKAQEIVRNQTNVLVTDGGFGEGNYGQLMEKLLKQA